MIVLATGLALLKQDGDRVTLTVPSGSEILEVSLSVHQTLGLAHTMPKALNGAIGCGPIKGLAASAEIIKFRQEEATGADAIKA